jgi:HK97 family phage major capsid protein
MAEVEQTLVDRVNDLIETAKMAVSKAEEGSKSMAAAQIVVENIRPDFEKLCDRLDSIETKANRLVANATTDANDPTVGAFVTYLREQDAHAYKAAAANSLKMAMSTDIWPSGGAVVVPPSISANIINYARELDAIYQFADVQNIGNAQSWVVMKETSDDFGFGWVAERGTRAATDNGKFEAVTITPHALYTQPTVTNLMLNNSQFDLEGYVTRKAADKRMRAVGAAFVTGSGNGQPRGLQYGGFADIPTGAAATIPNLDCFRKTTFELLPQFLPNARWFMRRSTLLEIALKKDGTGQYIYQPGLAGGLPDTICGFPVAYSVTIPAVGAGNIIAYFGDMAQAYTVIETNYMTIVVDNVSTKGWTTYYTETSIGGDTTNSQAMVTLTVEAS